MTLAALYPAVVTSVAVVSVFFSASKRVYCVAATEISTTTNIKNITVTAMTPTPTTAAEDKTQDSETVQR